MKTWSYPRRAWDPVWNAWFCFRTSRTLREAEHWLAEFRTRRAAVKLVTGRDKI